MIFNKEKLKGKNMFNGKRYQLFLNILSILPILIICIQLSIVRQRLDEQIISLSIVKNRLDEQIRHSKVMWELQIKVDDKILKQTTAYLP